MDERTLRVLEYGKIKQMLANCAASSLGRRRAEKLRPSIEPGWVRSRLAETTEMRQLMQSEKGPPLGGLTDISSLLSAARSRGILEPEQLLQVAGLMRCGRRVAEFFGSRAEDVPRLAALADRLHLHQSVEDEINRCINEDADIRTDASAELKQLKGKIARLEDEIRRRIDGILQHQQQRGVLQEPVIVQRSGRYCLAVKQTMQSRFDGIVHDRSDSGATVFMEPAELVPKGNDLRSARLQMQAEVTRILKELTGYVAAIADSIGENMRTLGIIDFIGAKATLAGKMDAAEPQLVAGRRLNLRSARHPFIPRDEVVPIDIRIGDEFDTLVVTGPNTGGKTVTLKTVGLLALMTQSGLHIPADPASQMTIWEHILADIGDEQSIEQSLSTFSSHMTQIVKIINRVDAYQRQNDNAGGESDGLDALVLLDELGAGTDPAEGAALACSLLTELQRAGCCTIATTHHNDLKAFAYATEGMQNASVEFDVKTLEPTYRLRIGRPGASNAFEIAQRLGLPRTVVGRARSHLSGERHKFETAVSEVQKQQQRLRDTEQQAEASRRDLQELKQEYQSKLEDLEARRDKAIRDGFEEAERIVEAADQQARNIIARLQSQESQSAVTQQARDELLRLKDEIQTERREKEHRPQTEPQQQEKRLDEVLLHDPVHVPALDKDGIVVDIPQEGVAEVQVGSMRTEVKFEDLQPPKQETSEQSAAIAERMQARKSMSVPPEIDLRGKTVGEAILDVEKYLDDAQLARLDKVRIIHGKGTGALRKGIREFLENQPNVRQVRAAARKNGGDGATEVLF